MSTEGAKSYFSSALEKADYYINDQELKGRFQGKLSRRMGLRQEAKKEDFFALCENIHPKSGRSLTPRNKKERTVGYDINFHCPKSVSIIHALNRDDHIIKLFQSSVTDTMLEIEKDAMTRIRKNDQYQDRHTGELVWADFTHQTARPVEGHLPDPHLHSHCFVFNATWDDVEKRYKAVQFRDIKRDMPYYQARFHKILSDKLIEAGYEIIRTKNSFEIKGVPKDVISHFSKRTDEIGRIAKEKGIDSAKDLDALGARTRAKKKSGLTMDELRQGWVEQIHSLKDKDNPEHQAEYDTPIRYISRLKTSYTDPEASLTFSINHCFERASVVPERKLLAAAYRNSTGEKSVSVNQIDQAMKEKDDLIRVQEHGQIMCTTKTVLREEQQMVLLAKGGLGKFAPIYTQLPSVSLSGQQKTAVEHILTTTNQVSIIRGVAGSGKTTLMKEAIKNIEATGRKVTVVAPTAQASRGVLKGDGFEDAETVATLISNEVMQNNLKDQVLWVDEAGLLGTSDMKKLLEIAKQQKARLVLGGDTRQHSSVIRGDALRILNTVGGIKTAEVNKIYRQRKEMYKSIVKNLSEGNIKTAIDQLDGLGAIKTVDPLSPQKQLVKDYIQTIEKKKSALIISPTHKQGEDVTEAIRRELKAKGILGKKEIYARKLQNLNFTEAEKSDYRQYRLGQIIQFNQNQKGINRGSQWAVVDVDGQDIHLKGADNKSTMLPLKEGHFDVFEELSIGLSKGDKIHITKNCFDMNNKRLNNGQSLLVKSVSKSGKLTLISPTKQLYHIEHDFGHISHAYCITSHASQGKTVDEVFIHQPASTFPATDAKQFYVSVSRARDHVHIYTDDKEELIEHASVLGDRMSAMELVNRKKHYEHMHINYSTKEMDLPNPEPRVIKEKLNYTLDYEP